MPGASLVEGLGGVRARESEGGDGGRSKRSVLSNRLSSASSPSSPGEEEPPPLVVQDEMKVRMTEGVDHPPL